MRLLVKPPFRFLDLPPEIRNIVYHHHFALYRTPEYQKQFREMKMLPDAILNVNRLIYEEATHSLYSNLFMRITIMGMKNLHGNESPAARIARVMPKLSHVLRHMSTIHLEIRWPDPAWHYWSKQFEKYVPYFMDLEANVETVCTSLAELPNLRRVKILFVMETPYSSRTRAPAKHRIRDLLTPLKLLRRANPDIVIELPGYCPISTAELAELQKDCAEGSNRRNDMNEDMEERLGDLRLLGKEPRRTDLESGL